MSISTLFLSVKVGACSCSVSITGLTRVVSMGSSCFPPGIHLGCHVRFDHVPLLLPLRSVVLQSGVNLAFLGPTLAPDSGGEYKSSFTYSPLFSFCSQQLRDPLRNSTDGLGLPASLALLRSVREMELSFLFTAFVGGVSFADIFGEERYGWYLDRMLGVVGLW
ncbi:hypothetical protein K402DRAFT_151284 [Aulographum hederae CBS 113979]|uniref:Uncharacterized protein n=1 Tax=Aulographum hederae CBS 113979 TaxID=1176131 RepID=A0A6G1GTR8_9PEZI|nr:hypothetical protein K402DRAFT_151284 [Aulographum hederae CBS 113979]